jgi:Tfp pilus assembly protein PilN
MPQQINLCTPILLKERRYFSAQTMVQALCFLVLVGGGFVTYWVWSLNAASEGFKKTLALQTRELESLEAALKQGKAGAGSADAALSQVLQARRTELLQREKLLDELQQGLFRPGWGHSARLQLLAQSIPAQVWVTDVKANDVQLEVSGFTLEPAALNNWVGKLAASPLLKDQKLATVKVENATAAMVKAGATTAAPAPRPVWTFNLVNAVGKPTLEAVSKP